MFGLTSKSEIDILKAELRKWYGAYKVEVSGLDCGATMAQYIRPEAAMLAERVNKIAADLKKIDPDFPKSWTPL